MLTFIMRRLALAGGTLLTIAALVFVAVHPSPRPSIERYYTVNGPEYRPLTPRQFEYATCVSREVKDYDEGMRVHICNR